MTKMLHTYGLPGTSNMAYMRPKKNDVWVPRYVYSLIPPKMQDSVAENSA